MRSNFVCILALVLVLNSCKSSMYTTMEYIRPIDVISVKDGQFKKGDKPYYFVGTNYWYGPLIGAKKIGDRKRLIKELDLMKSIGIDNLRILVGAEGDGGDYKVKPALQYEQGKYNKKLLDGLDFLLAEMRKRDMRAVLYMNNNWIWSGGMSEYLKWNGYGAVPNPFLEQYSWEQYMAYTKQFHSCEPCKQAFYKHIRFIIGRTNKYTKIKYVDDHTIMSWQVANEPRVLAKDNEAAYTDWLNATVDLIQSLDPNHLISTGTEGKASTQDDIEMYERVHSNKNIDYLTMHMWPKNWSWYDIENEKGSLQTSIKNAHAYLDEHIVVAEKSNRPIVMSEFGFPRAKESLSPEASVENRDVFYNAICNRIVDSKVKKSVLAGLNFWGFAGYGKARDFQSGKWEEGDDFTADPPQEPQGLNSVFATDKTTLALIKAFNQKLKE